MAEAHSGEGCDGQDVFGHGERQFMLSGSQLQVGEDLFAEELVVRRTGDAVLTRAEPTTPSSVCVEVDPGVEIPVALIVGRVGHGDRNRIVPTGDEELRPDDTVFVVQVGRVVAAGRIVGLPVQLVVDFRPQMETAEDRVSGAVVRQQGRIAG